ncbi:hypothetical protein GCM10007198_04240 [Microbacterium aerolatum]|uniref:Uncharacterized protein n=1 Tax=Microbacterium aerolatum TaxID=153731 RepID=A0A511ADQ9_9MICO|nr:hypothetical protein MAE01_14700 [Microbacterium aerolatum]GGB16809.1 hypothetical protein GCM10007198_04240 [Microbacterium aerolatum]
MCEMVVMSAVVSARGSRQMHSSEPPGWMPVGPTAGSFSGTSSNCASTSSDRIARQSSGIATGFDVGVAVGFGLSDADGDGLSEAADVAGVEASPDGLPVHPASAVAISSATATTLAR